MDHFRNIVSSARAVKPIIDLGWKRANYSNTNRHSYGIICKLPVEGMRILLSVRLGVAIPYARGTSETRELPLMRVYGRCIQCTYHMGHVSVAFLLY
jgi:hypothetical protein